MAGARRVCQAALNREISDKSKQIFEIDIKIEKFTSTKTNLSQIPNLETAKWSLQRDIVDLQIQLELAKARNRNRNN